MGGFRLLNLFIVGIAAFINVIGIDFVLFDSADGEVVFFKDNFHFLQEAVDDNVGFVVGFFIFGVLPHRNQRVQNLSKGI